MKNIEGRTAANSGDSATEEAVAWARSATNDAVQWFIAKGVLPGAVLEAKPAWALPQAAFIARVREQGNDDRFFWLIGGKDYSFDWVDSSVASSAREAARHFSLKWQLEAARVRAGEGSEQDEGFAARLERQAESLYRLVSDDPLWRTDSPAGSRT